MSTSSTTKPVATSATRALPLVVCFDEEPHIQELLLDLQRYRRASFQASQDLAHDLERIVLCGNETLVAQHYDELRRPNFRLIALSDHRFRDPRLDALVYAYLPTKTPQVLVDRTVDNALDHINLIHVREQINQRLRGVTREIQELNKIGAALSAEHRLDRLLALK